MLSLAQQWLVTNTALFAEVFGRDNVVLDYQWHYLWIAEFPLPLNMSQSRSRLLMVFDDPESILTLPPDRFYIDQHITRSDGGALEHYFEGPGYNDMAHEGWARFSFHVTKGWRPSPNVVGGTTLVDILDQLFDGMHQAGEE